MEITYDWSFETLERYPTFLEQTDVVFKVYWKVYAHTGSCGINEIGEQYVTYNSGSTFIPFNELTQDIVYGWVTSSMGEESYNNLLNRLKDNIQNQITPATITQQAPWL